LLLLVLAARGARGLSLGSTMPVLYCKPGKDGASVGDCPFTHYSRMALELAGNDYQLKPTTKEAKPEWLLEKHNGAMPCLALSEDGEGAVAESSKIAAAALPPSETDSASLEATSSFFGAIARYLKNTDGDAALKEKLDEALLKLDARLAEVPGPFLSGTDTLGLADCSVATKLYVLLEAGNHFNGFTLDAAKFPHVKAYVDAVFASDVFLKTQYPKDEMIHGWAEARGGGH